MKEKKKFIIVGIVALLLLTLCVCFVGCGKNNNRDKNRADEILDSDDVDTSKTEILNDDTDEQNQILNDKDSYDFEDIWGEGSSTNSDVINGENASNVGSPEHPNSNDGNLEPDNSGGPKDDGELDAGGQDNKNGGYGPLI